MRAALLAAMLMFALPTYALDRDQVVASCTKGTQADIKAFANLLKNGTPNEALKQRFKVVAANFKMDKTYRETMLEIIEDLPDRLDMEKSEKAIKACVDLYVEDVSA